MKSKMLWVNAVLALSLSGAGLSGPLTTGGANDLGVDPSPILAEAVVAFVSPSEPDATRRPEAPAVVAGLGTSLFISGTSTAYVQVPHNAALDPSAEMTLEAWIRRGVVGCQTILGKDFNTSYWFGMCSGVLRFYSGGGPTSQDGPTTIPANVWTHVAVTWKSGGQRVYYINGQEDYRGVADVYGTSASALGIGYDIGSGCCVFKGNLAEVRVWNIARMAEDIRRTMHIRLDEPRPGLVANWHLNDSYADSVGGFNGAAAGAGTINFSGPQPPPQPPLVPIDKDFARLPSARDGFGFVVLTNTNTALMLGGYATSAPTNQVLRLDLGSGSTSAFGPGLPSARYGGAAAYAPSTGKVYLFGGQNSSYAPQSTIYTVDASTGAVATHPVGLPVAVAWSNAVYQSATGRIAVIGGELNLGYTNTIQSLDLTSGTLVAHTLVLPDPRAQAAAAVSSATGRVYLFGGRRTGGTSVSAIYEIDLGDGLTGGSVTTLTASLPNAS